MKGKENDILPLVSFFKAEKSHEGNILQDTVITKSLMFGKSLIQKIWKNDKLKNKFI